MAMIGRSVRSTGQGPRLSSHAPIRSVLGMPNMIPIAVASPAIKSNSSTILDLIETQFRFTHQDHKHLPRVIVHGPYA